MALWLGRVILDFRAPPDMRFGTAMVPCSDALTPWLEGALRYYLVGEPIHILYRPSVGIFFGSLLALFGRVEFIPLFFVAACALLFIVSSVTLPRSSAVALVVSVLLCSVPDMFARTMGASLIGTLLVDFPSFVFLLGGILLLSSALSRPGAVGASFCVAFLLLGLNAAIRGPMLVGGPIIFIAVHLLYLRKMSPWATPLALLLFALPPALDLLIQRHDMIINNGLSNLYCVVIDRAHSWSPECHKQFLAENPSFQTVLGRYLNFALSRDGVSLFGQYVAGRLAIDSRMLVSLYFFGALALCLLYELAACAKESAYMRTSILKLAPAPLLWIGLSLIAPALVRDMTWAQTLQISIVLALGAVLLTLIAVMREAPLTWLCLVTYLSAVIFFSLIGLPFLGRTAGTYTFLLPLGVLAAVVEEPLDHEPGGYHGAQDIFACLCMAAVIVLYTAVFTIPTEAKRRYQAEVAGKSAAIKVANSSDPARNRSLYYFGDGRLLYTYYDGAPLWSVRTFTRIEPAKSDPNTSYKTPIRFQ